MADFSLYEHTNGQLNRLCRVLGFADGPLPGELLGLLLGPAGASRLDESSEWPSGVSDDTTPVEFSIAFDATGECAVRVLGESVGVHPERKFLDVVAEWLGLRTGRFDAVQDLFLPETAAGGFTLWYSLIFRADSRPQLKVYLNPQISGPERADELVRMALGRLGIARAYDSVAAAALGRPGRDRFSYFALDLDDTPRSRVKLYVSHEGAETADVVRAASLVPGVEPERIREFCAISGAGNGPFSSRPLISSYSFTGGDAVTPSSYSLYVPIRDYVADDEVARARVLALMAQYDLDSTKLDRAIAAVSGRALRDGVGLIPHVSLRLSPFGSGITVYLSSEAYSVLPPKRRSVLGLVPAG
ncbi:tryptophan dimethylallyltransferase family protein [Kibdelosporangium phytohabitans]|uniref:Tryptophan dimethylallyltransferase n=1 Tax=Kibdelosporangium phytohabitans TaxID=860235 RepID=A0A0N9I2S5_9PSEU|nr:tryptophan dimethylallyltransferase family protein [Kibdelosporangium phytohabitans]ALG08781.1 tryptophan dimethylallyltransferase [Kibdelosporangium phytohabitans]MBE1470092.1 DMATS type aromatic prenyltransferase [Kibdelosporangium phytohabitans]